MLLSKFYNPLKAYVGSFVQKNPLLYKIWIIFLCVQKPDNGSYFDRISSSSQSQNYFLKVPFNISPYTHNTNHELRELHKDLDIVTDIKK